MRLLSDLDSAVSGVHARSGKQVTPQMIELLEAAKAIIPSLRQQHMSDDDEALRLRSAIAACEQEEAEGKTEKEPGVYRFGSFEELQEKYPAIVEAELKELRRSERITGAHLQTRVGTTEHAPAGSNGG